MQASHNVLYAGHLRTKKFTPVLLTNIKSRNWYSCLYWVRIYITLIASPPYAKSRNCDQFLKFLFKNVTERAHARLSTRLGTFFRTKLNCLSHKMSEIVDFLHLLRSNEYSRACFYVPDRLKPIWQYFFSCLLHIISFNNWSTSRIMSIKVSNGGYHLFTCAYCTI